jgi:hypothetical protein
MLLYAGKSRIRKEKENIAVLKSPVHSFGEDPGTAGGQPISSDQGYFCSGGLPRWDESGGMELPFLD